MNEQLKKKIIHLESESIDLKNKIALMEESEGKR